MAVTGLDHFNIRAPYDTLCTVRDFYADVVGLTVGERPPFKSRGFWLYAGNRAVLHLSELVMTSETEVPTAESSALDHIAFDCRDFDATVKHLSERGIAFEVSRVPLSGQKQLFLSDPVGVGVELNFAGDA